MSTHSSPEEADTYCAAIDITTVFGLLAKHGGERIRQFELEYGVRFSMCHPNGYRVKPERVTRQNPLGYCGTMSRGMPVLLRMSGTPTALQVAVAVFRALVLGNTAAYRTMCHARWNEKVSFTHTSLFFFSFPPFFLLFLARRWKNAAQCDEWLRSSSCVVACTSCVLLVHSFRGSHELSSFLCLGVLLLRVLVSSFLQLHRFFSACLHLLCPQQQPPP